MNKTENNIKSLDTNTIDLVNIKSMNKEMHLIEHHSRSLGSTVHIIKSLD